MFALIARLHADGVAILLVEQNVVQSLEVADRAYILPKATSSCPAPPPRSAPIQNSNAHIWDFET